ncbi:DNA methyltransferase [Desulfovulcanus sp.]
MNTIEKDQTKVEAQNNRPEIIEISLENLSVPLSHPRRNKGDMESLQRSIRKNGLLEPITVCKSEDDDSYMVIDGTRRLTVFTEFGWESAPCIVVESMPLGKIAHYAFEKNMERRSLSPIEIALHIKEMQKKYGYSLRELDALGYGSPALISQKVKLLDLPGGVKEMIESGKLTTAHGVALGKLEKAKTQEKMAKQACDFGWTAKRLNIAIKNLLKKGAVPPKKRVKIPDGDIPGVYFKDSKDMSELPDNSVHLIVTSPPYGVGKEYEVGNTFEDLLDTVQGVMSECARVLVPGGIMALNVGDIQNFKGKTGKSDVVQIQLMGHFYQTALRRHQIYLTDQIIWQKPLSWANRKHVSYSENTVHASYRIIQHYEPVYIFRKNGQRELPDEETRMKSLLTKEQWTEWVQGIWKIQTVQKMGKHPCEWPEELPKRLIKMYSFENDVVLDPFLGSGTTVKVARELNRKAIGYERELQYKSVIMEKLGVNSHAECAQPMLDFVKQAMVGPAVEDAETAAEAAAGAKLFRDEEKAEETASAA